jgi:nicotinamidase/pyrazinamidase
MTSRRTAFHNAVFWDVDTQADFMLPGGRLYARGAEMIIPNLERLTRYARLHHLLVIASADAHQPDDPEFSQWPPHCLAGTPGQQKLKQTRLAPAYVLPAMPASLPEDLSAFRQIVVEKRSVDVFDNPNIEALLAKLHTGVPGEPDFGSLRQKPEVTVYGVVTEVCVGLAVQGLLKRGYQVRIVTDAIRALSDQAGEHTLAQLSAQGARLVTTDDVGRGLALPQAAGEADSSLRS